MKRLVGVVRSKGAETAVVGVDRQPKYAEDLPEQGTWVELGTEGGPWQVQRVLATPGSGLAALYDMVVKARIHPTHTERVQAEADAFVGADGIDDPTLVDLTRLPFVPIDEVTSKDLDQAVAIERRADGYTVWYALADAAYYVPPGSALFEDALRRGATYYLPGLMVPMLPAVLSEGLISLNAGVDRRAMVFELHLDSEGVCIGRTIHRARVHCRHKLDFHGVQAFLDGAEVDWDADVQASLRLLPEVGKLRIQQAEERDVVRYRRTEVDVALQGLHFVAMDGPRNDVEKYNEQISLLTNVQGALFLQERAGGAIEPIYRVHEAPNAERFTSLREMTRAVAASHGLDPAIWVWSEPDSLNTYLDRLPHGPVADALHRQAMIINRPSHFAGTPGAHFGVGASVYGRYTAPMREVVGIFLHNEVWEALAGKGAQDAELVEKVIQAANDCRDLQRQFNRNANRLVLDDLFAATADEIPATVLGLTPSRVHVQLDDPKVDVKVYVAHLNERWGTTLRLEGVELVDDSGPRVRLGDRLNVRVVERDSKRDRWNLSLDALVSADQS